MTFEQIEKETAAIISEMKNCITEEERYPAKSANYGAYKERLAAALKLQSDIDEAKKIKAPANILEFELEELKTLIY